MNSNATQGQGAPAPETFAVTRRPLDVEDYIDIVRRHKGWIFGPTFAGLVIAVAVAFFWPDTYVSEARIRVVPPQVPERYVATNVSTQMSERVMALAQTILSRARLADLINSYGLYPRERKRLPMEDVIEKMQQAIRVSPVFPLHDAGPGRVGSVAFQIEFAYEDRYQAQRVVRELVTRFIDESITGRASQSVMTTEFLRDKLAEAKKELDAIESRLTEYKIRHAGRLPDQLQMNLHQLSALQTRMNALQGSMSRASQEKLLLETQLRSLKEQWQGLGTAVERPAEAAAKSERLAQLERQILTLETQLSGLKEQYKETHPDVRRLEGQLSVLRRQRDALLAEEEQQRKLAQAAPPKKEPQRPSREVQDLDAAIKRLEVMIRTKDMEMDQYVKEQAQLEELIKQFQQRIEATPLSEREYINLVRDYNLAKQRYDDLSAKSAQSEIATDLENRKQGETLELLDAASLPTTPTQPKRLKIIGAGLCLGLFLGVSLAAVREVRDTSLKNLKDVRAYTSLPVLGSIPLLESDLVVRRRRRLLWLAWSTAFMLGFLIMIGSVYYYYSKQA
jgi:succinoglycan biosynthesis transport protein ExoP